MSKNTLIYSLSPSIVQKIWGGSWLDKIKLSKVLAGDPVGETWEVSIHGDGPSYVGDKELGELVSSRSLPYLVKFIDAAENLSIQVHPADAFAKKHENSLGKTECWIILGAEKGAGIFLGLKAGISREKLEYAIKAKEDLSDLLQFHEVSRGDFFYVPAGSIHAIGAGVRLAEVQQNSGITYRVWDWNRVDESGKSRPLHIDKAMEVINFSEDKNDKEYFKIKKNNFSVRGKNYLLNFCDFKVQVINLLENEQLPIEISQNNRVSSILVLAGTGMIKRSDQQVAYTEYSAFAFPFTNGQRELNLNCKENSIFLFIY